MTEKDVLLDYIIFSKEENLDNTFVKLNIMKNRENKMLRDELKRYRTRLKMTLKELKEFKRTGVFGKKRGIKLDNIIESIELLVLDLEEKRREHEFE